VPKVKKQTIDVEDKIQLIKEKREKREHEKMLKAKNLGDSDSEGDDVSSWINKSRQKEEIKKLEQSKKSLLSRIEKEEGKSLSSPCQTKVDQKGIKKKNDQH